MNLISFETPPRRHESTTTKAKETSATCLHSHLDLSLGISSSHGSYDGAGAGCSTKASYGARGGHVGCMSSGTARTLPTTGDHDIATSSCWFMPSPTGFMHPWSLAARQQKAAAEQDRNIARTSTYVPRDACIVPLSTAVGWPPVHTSRRNLVSTQYVPKSGATAHEEEGTNKRDVENVVGQRNYTNTKPQIRPCMFAKVHMEGYLIGRKINLRAHHSYHSLSRVLKKMTKNFFCPADSSTWSEEENASDDNFIFLYEDYEGDRMLVGDVPWELFLASVKRLYIARNPTSQDKADEGVTKDVPNQETTK